MVKEDDKDFDNSTVCQVCNNVHVDGEVQVRYNCHITGKCRGSAQIDCKINAKSNHKISIVLHN